MSTQTTEKLERFLKLALTREVLEAGRNAPVSGRHEGAQSPWDETPREDDAPERKEPSPFPLRRILVPVDFSEPSKHALAYATRFAERFGAQLVLLHVVSPVIYSTPGMMPPQILELSHDLQRGATERLSHWGEEVAGTENAPIPPPETHVCTGVAHREIARVARETEADLIVIATRGFTGAKGFFLGSTTAHLVREAPCPVLVVREHEHEFI